MRALDRLPAAVRTAIMYSPARHSPAAILKALHDGFDETSVLQAIEAKNEEMCAAYRAAIAAGKP